MFQELRRAKLGNSSKIKVYPLRVRSSNIHKASAFTSASFPPGRRSSNRTAKSCGVTFKVSRRLSVSMGCAGSCEILKFWSSIAVLMKRDLDGCQRCARLWPGSNSPNCNLLARTDTPTEAKAWKHDVVAQRGRTGLAPTLRLERLGVVEQIRISRYGPGLLSDGAGRQ
jgi:hypothetical protein